MSKRKEFVLIPFWIANAIKRNGMNLADVLDFTKVSQVGARSDLAPFVTLQQYFPEWVGVNQHNELVSRWLGSVNEQSLKIQDILAVEADPSYRADVQARLFDPLSKQEEYERAFNIYDLSPEVGGIVIYPGYFTADAVTNYHYELITAILKHLRASGLSHSESSATPFFQKYLELLTQRRVIV